MNNNQKKEIEQWYINERPLYSRLANKTKDLITELCLIENIEFHTIEFRAKEINTLLEKINKNKGKYAPKETQDLAGVRIIVYTKNDVESVVTMIKKHFSIIREEDTSTRLGKDKVGYSSRHIVVNFSKERLTLPENKEYVGKVIEIQVRTILQHAWAQINHSKDYKSTSSLPTKIQRNLGLIAGMLEVSDNEFQRLIDEIATYKNEVSIKTKSGDLNINIDILSLREYLDNFFLNVPNITKKFGPNDDSADTIISELKKFNINTLKELSLILGGNLKQALIKNGNETNYLGFLRDAMLLSNYDKYLSVAWGRDWNGIDLESRIILASLGLNFDEMSEKYPELDLNN